jgi:hypothetical protein
MAEAGRRVREIIQTLDPSEEITLVANSESVATLRRRERTSWPCQAGMANDTKHGMAPPLRMPVNGPVPFSPASAQQPVQRHG